MWLLNTSTFQLEQSGQSPTRYAMLSYYPAGNDWLFEDLVESQASCGKPGLRVLRGACLQAQNLGYSWLWSDTACIDRRSSAALSESINSLAQIYRGCELCIVYLDRFPSFPVPEDEVKQRLLDCNWTKNVWSLPHIIFPRIAYFYNCDWIKIGTKMSWLPQLSSVLGIDRTVLEDSACLEDYSIGRRISWASELSASRIEDETYALLGLLDTSMPILYGEGRRAFLRLQEEILKDTDDYSLFAWQSQATQTYRGIFARSPAEFLHFRSLPKGPFRIRGELQIHCSGVTIQAQFRSIGDEIRLGLEGPGGVTCWIALSQWDGNFVRCSSKLKWGLEGIPSVDVQRICVMRDVTTWVSNKIFAHSRFQHIRQEPFGGLSETVTTQPHEIVDVDRGSGTLGRRIKDEDVPNVPRTASVPKNNSLFTENLTAWLAYAESSGAGTPFRIRDHNDGPWTYGVNLNPTQDSRDGPDASEKNTSCGSLSGLTEGADIEIPCVSRDNIDPIGTPEMHTLSLDGLTDEMTKLAVEQFLSEYNRPSAKRSLLPWSKQSRKRPRTTRSPSYMNIEDLSDPEDNDTVILWYNKLGVDTFACPFYLRDKGKNRTCLTHYQLLSIQDVKEHLCMIHRQPIFCPICKQEFPTSRDRDDHIRSRPCIRKTSPTFDGITDGQAETLSMEETSSVSKEVRWFEIWDIVFPQMPRPDSPFFSATHEVSICSFRQFWLRHGQNIIYDFLKSKDIKTEMIKNEERTLATFYESVLHLSIERVFDIYVLK